MENDTTQTPPQAQPMQTPQEVATASSSEPTVPVSPVPIDEPKKGGSGMWVIIIILVVILVGAGGFYLYSTNKSSTTAETTATKQTQQELNSLQTELDAADLSEIEGDFTQIDRDLADL